MDKKAALSYLKLDENSSDVEVLEAFEESIFSIKKELLSKPIIVSRWKNKLQLVKQLISAKQTLLNTISEITNDDALDVSLDSSSVLSFMKDYEQQLSNAKLHFSNAQSDVELLSSMQNVISVQSHYEAHYTSFFEEEKLNGFMFEGKLSEQTNSAEIIAYLKIGNDWYASKNPCLEEGLRLKKLVFGV
ncbi:MAG: hypothetical protein ACLGGV_01225 [Bacteroidia bacterium]